MTLPTRPTRAVAGALLGSLLCGAAGTAGAQQVTLTFLTAEQEATVAPVIAAFEAAHPEIDVQHESVPFDSMNATIEARIGGQDPGIDVFMVDSPRIPALASRGFLKSQEDRRGEIEAVTNDTSIGVLQHEGELFALPYWNSTQLLYYNRDLLDAAGIPYPGIEQADRLTYQEVAALGAQAQAAGAEIGLILEQIDRYYQLQALYESAGAGPGLGGEGNLTPDVASDAWIEVTEFYRGLFESGVSPRGIAVDQMGPTFTSGGVAFYVGGPWQFQLFGAAEGLSYGIAPTPYFEGGEPAVPTDSWAMAVSPYTDIPEEAQLFAEYLTLDPAGNLLSVQNNPIPPVNEAAYGEWIARIEASDPEIGPAARTIMTYELAENSVSRPRSVGYVAFEEVMNRAFSDIRNGAEVRPTLEQAAQQLQSTLSRIR